MKNCLSHDLIGEKFVSPYKNILLMPELGRVEMNEGKLLLKLLWYPIISHLSTLLGFRTPITIEGNKFFLCVLKQLKKSYLPRMFATVFKTKKNQPQRNVKNV